MTKKKKKKVPAKKPAKKNQPIKEKKLSPEEKKKLAGTVAAGIGIGIGSIFWLWLKRALFGIAAVLIIIVGCKLLWARGTGNPYPWGFFNR